MSALAGRVAIVTGAGRGLGRAYALALAREGAAVIVNDPGMGSDGRGGDASPAHAVVAEIRAAGGRAEANLEDVSDWNGAERLVRCAVDAFGGLDVVVNNAGVLRDRSILELSEDDWDTVLRVHLKGHFAVMRAAMVWWAAEHVAGRPVKGSVINSSSIAGMAGFGTANYASAKGGISSLSVIAAGEGAHFGVRVNAIAPNARTRLTLQTFGDVMERRFGAFDFFDPEHVAPLVVWLAREDCEVTGAVFHIGGNQVGLFRQWPIVATEETDGRWDQARLDEAVPRLLEGRTAMGSVATDFSTFNRLLRKAQTR